jgi:hypothetical protein
MQLEMFYTADNFRQLLSILIAKFPLYLKVSSQILQQTLVNLANTEGFPF